MNGPGCLGRVTRTAVDLKEHKFLTAYVPVAPVGRACVIPKARDRFVHGSRSEMDTEAAPDVTAHRPPGAVRRRAPGDVSSLRIPAPEVARRRRPAPRAGAPSLRRVLVAADAGTLVVGWLLVMVVLTWRGAPPSLVTAVAFGLTATPLGLVLLAANGLYRRRVCAIRSLEIARLARVGAMLWLTTVIFVMVMAGTAAGAGPLSIVAGCAFGVVLIMERGLLREWINVRRAVGEFQAPVVVLGGEAESTARTARLLNDHPVLGFDVLGLLGPTRAGAGLPFDWLGHRPRDLDTDTLARASGIVLDAGSLTGAQLNAAVREAMDAGLYAHIVSGLQGVSSRRVSLSGFADEVFLLVTPSAPPRRRLVGKRTVDVVLGTLLLLLALPVLLAAATAIVVFDRAPVLYRQERIGHEGRRFVLYKLRTMMVGADSLRDELGEENLREGPLFKLRDDPRVTGVGRVLRALSIDELPQLWNVLAGTMSLVGPRPALPGESAQFDVDLQARLRVKPGMTGLWQVEARDLPSFDLYRRYDLLYVENWSLGLDLAILTRTVAVVGLRGLRAMLPGKRRDLGAAVLE